MKNSMHNICTCTQIWTTLSVLTRTKPNSNPITFLKFLELGKCTRRRKYKVQTVIAHTVLHTTKNNKSDLTLHSTLTVL